MVFVRANNFMSVHNNDYTGIRYLAHYDSKKPLPWHPFSPWRKDKAQKENYGPHFTRSRTVTPPYLIVIYQKKKTTYVAYLTSFIVFLM